MNILTRWSTRFSMILVIALIGIDSLPAMSVETRTSTAKSMIRSIDMALKLFELDVGRYPTREEGLPALLSKSAVDAPKNWDGPYLKLIPKDPWGNPYRYSIFKLDNSNTHGVYSTGPDGVSLSNGNDEDDINSWDPKSPRRIEEPQQQSFLTSADAVVAFFSVLVVVAGILTVLKIGNVSYGEFSLICTICIYLIGFLTVTCNLNLRMFSGVAILGIMGLGIAFGVMGVRSQSKPQKVIAIVSLVLMAVPLIVILGGL